MKIIKQNQLGKYLFWLGPFLVTVGLTTGLVSGQWGIVGLLFIITGTIISGLWVVWQGRQTKWWNRRSTQVGTNALVSIVAVLVILGLVNFLATRYNLRKDLTEAQLFTLAPQTQELVRGLPQSVKVWIFDLSTNAQDRELLENYRRENSNFQFEYVDPQSRPGLANKFGVQDYGEVYLEFGDNRQLVQTLNVNERLSEVRLTNRLQQITSSTTTPVYFLQGHGEAAITPSQGGISQAIQKLAERNYTASPLNLVEKSQVPEDAGVVIVAGPKQELFDKEVKALQNYLNNGGNVLFMIDPNTDNNLNSLLQEWGIKLDNRLVVDVSGRGVGLGPAVPIITEYGQHPITKEFGNGISFYRLARPLEITSVAGIESTNLFSTKAYPDSWAESDLNSEKLEFDSQTDTPGPLTLAVALSKTIPGETKPSPPVSPTPSPTIENETNPPTPEKSEQPQEQTKIESRLVVIGDSDFATDELFEQQLNGDVFLNSVTWLSQQDQQPLSIRPKEAKNRRINLSVAQGNFLTWSSLLVLPLMGLMTGVIIWWKRR
ncbi:Gldg family protein [Chrysosporum bergii ANA360D]|uniref:Gldg family protein n=1 Tax=Chrysosporum bergii ANA360D TaxID=617107 RepID=A0AA43GPF4_9CYAN|nr:Gldg family protein [Chrysosporum bergii]MDH6059356.1 Gldg family protein [Chrysosporum bergii ANA360D]